LREPIRPAPRSAEAPLRERAELPGSGPDTIQLPAGTFTLGALGSLNVQNDMTLRGAAAGTVIEATSSRILSIFSLVQPNVTLEDITFRHGRAPAGTSGSGSPVVGVDGGPGGEPGGDATGVAGGAGADGGAVFNNFGTLTISRCTFEDNLAGDGGNGGQAAGGNGGAGSLPDHGPYATGHGGTGTGGAGGTGGSGGAIYSNGSVIVSDSTFIDNAAGSGGAGGSGFAGQTGDTASADATGSYGGSH